MNLRFEPAAASGREVLHVEGLAKAFPGPAGGVLFRGFSAKVRRGERVGLVGPNGSGKTTLLRILAGEARPDEGGLLWGAGVEIGFFDQKLEGLDGRGTVLDEIMGAADFTIGEARSYLARFLFRGDDVDTPVRALSGGERNRLLLARLVISRTNVLLLDEPTNHLDIPAREVLEDALAAFPGTLFFATHDRYLLRLATRLWVFGQGRVIDFRGSYADWEALRAEEAAGERGTGAAGRAAPAGWVAPAGRVASAGRRDSALRTASVGRTDPARGASSPVPGGGPAAGSGDAAEPAPLSKNEARRIRERVAEVEREIGRQEAVLRECEARLSDPALREDGGALLEAGERYAEADRVLGELYEEWERLAGLLQTEDSRGPSQK